MILWILSPAKKYFWLYNTPNTRKHSTTNCTMMMKKKPSLEDITLPSKDLHVCINTQRSVTALLCNMKAASQKSHFLTLISPYKHVLLALQWHSHLHLAIFMLSDCSPHIECIFGITLQKNVPHYFSNHFTHLCKACNTYLLSTAHNYSLFKYLSQNYISAMFTLFSTLLMNPDSEVHAAEYMDSSDWFKEPKVNQL